jgi:hypothetical protein
MVPTPAGELDGDELGTVITAERARCAVDGNQLVENLRHPFGRQRQRHLHREGLPIPFIEHVQRAEARPAVEHIRHEIHGPHPVEDRGRVERLPIARRDPALRPALQVEPEDEGDVIAEFRDERRCASPAVPVPTEDRGPGMCENAVDSALFSPVPSLGATHQPRSCSDRWKEEV